LYRAGQAMNSLPSQILNVGRNIAPNNKNAKL